MSDLSAAIARVRAYIAGESSVILPGDIPAVCAAAERARCAAIARAHGAEDIAGEIEGC